MKAHQMKLLIYCLFFFSSTTVFAQDFLLRGVIKERGSQKRIVGASVTNKRNGFSVTTSDLGLFELKSKVGDTLLIVKRDYPDTEVPVLTNRDFVAYLSNDVTTLNEVSIFGSTKKQDLKDIQRDFRNKGVFYGGKPPVLSYLFTPLTALYELFGTTPKNARRFGKYYATELQQTEIDGFFNESLIKKNTDLSGQNLEKFMLDYRPDYEQAKKWTEYDAIKYIRDSYKKYTDTLGKK